jgi:ankyrin repeat protein
MRDVLVKKDADNLTAISLAAKFGHTVVVDRLLSKLLQTYYPSILAVAEQGEDDTKEDWILAEGDEKGNTPLHFATRRKACDLVDVLTGQAQESIGFTAEEQRKRGVVFYSGVEVDDVNGRMPIHLAVLSGNFEMVQKLCQEHKRSHESLDLFDDQAQTPLHLAARWGLVDIAETLLE